MLSNKQLITPPGFNDFGTDYTSLNSSYSVVYGGIEKIQQYIFNFVVEEILWISILISMAIVVGIIYTMIRLKQIREDERIFFESQPISASGRGLFSKTNTSVEFVTNDKWREVIRLSQSNNSADWRQAIIEADIMLDSALTKLGYTGDGIGEKMKQVKREDINTIDEAWDAHKVRNRIAHDGSDFELNNREMRRVVGLYERVFKELGYI